MKTMPKTPSLHEEPYPLRILLLILLWIVLFFGICRIAAGQNLMPMAVTNRVKLPPNTNITKVGDYTYTNVPPGTTAYAPADSGVVGYTTVGTNIVSISGSERTFNNGNLNGRLEEGQAKLSWYDTSTVLWSPDLINWYTVTAVGHYTACLAETNQMFFTRP